MRTFDGPFEIFEVSLVLVAANPECKIISVKEK